MLKLWNVANYFGSCYFLTWRDRYLSTGFVKHTHGFSGHLLELGHTEARNLAITGQSVPCWSQWFIFLGSCPWRARRVSVPQFTISDVSHLFDLRVVCWSSRHLYPRFSRFLCLPKVRSYSRILNVFRSGRPGAGRRVFLAPAPADACFGLLLVEIICENKEI